MGKMTSPYLKKSAGGKPPARKEMKKGGLGGRGVQALLGASAPPKQAAAEMLGGAAGRGAETAMTPPASAGVIEVVASDIERSPWQARS